MRPPESRPRHVARVATGCASFFSTQLHLYTAPIPNPLRNHSGSPVDPNFFCYFFSRCCLLLRSAMMGQLLQLLLLPAPRNRNSPPPRPPAACRPLSALRLPRFASLHNFWFHNTALTSQSHGTSCVVSGVCYFDLALHRQISNLAAVSIAPLWIPVLSPVRWLYE